MHAQWIGQRLLSLTCDFCGMGSCAHAGQWSAACIDKGPGKTQEAGPGRVQETEWAEQCLLPYPNP